jgi:hypothetical protein
MTAPALISVHYARPSTLPPPSSSGLSAVRSQVAVARALLDELERAASPADASAIGEQVTVELSRLGCRVLEAAAALAKATGTELPR